MDHDKVKLISDFIDKKMTEISGRELLSTSEVTDFLLDIRLFLLTNDQVEAPNG
jgi:hypothetical protein